MTSIHSAFPFIRRALDRKSRTTIRNVEAAIQGASSAATECVRLARNLPWMSLFDRWPALSSFIVAGIVNVVPTGGNDDEARIYGPGWCISGRLASRTRAVPGFPPAATM